jgi:hypothetical protein
MTVTLLARPELSASVNNPYPGGPPENGGYWAPPGGAEYRLNAGENVKAAWWTPIAAFSALAQFELIGLEVRQDDVYLALMSVPAPAGNATIDIAIYLAK